MNLHNREQELAQMNELVCKAMAKMPKIETQMIPDHRRRFGKVAMIKEMARVGMLIEYGKELLDREMIEALAQEWCEQRSWLSIMPAEIVELFIVVNLRKFSKEQAREQFEQDVLSWLNKDERAVIPYQDPGELLSSLTK